MEAWVYYYSSAIAKLYKEKYIKVAPVLSTLGPPNAQQALPSARSYNSQYIKISFNEMQLRKAKGLCFKCNEKFTPSHWCANRRLLLLQWNEDSLDNSL